MKSSPTIRVDIFVAGDIGQAKQFCREFCALMGLCVTVEPVDYIYTGGEEAGVRVGLINYPKFPATEDEMMMKARQLAEGLRHRLCQRSYSVVGPHETIWHSEMPD